MKDILYLILLNLLVFWAISAFIESTETNSAVINANQGGNIYILFAISVVVIALGVIHIRKRIR